MLPASRLLYEKAPSMRRSRPTAPSASSWRARCHCGWCTIMKASAASTPAASRAAISPSKSPACMAIGFSQSTCLPAFIALTLHSTWSGFGSGM
jgi:hypothetical protein